MIWSNDAPTLERELHRRFVRSQVNKVNPRKEFFRVGVTEIRQCAEDMGLQASWTMSAEAAQYRETLVIERSLGENNAQAKEWLRAQMQYEPDIPVIEEATSLESSGIAS